MYEFSIDRRGSDGENHGEKHVSNEDLARSDEEYAKDEGKNVFDNLSRFNELPELPEKTKSKNEREMQKGKNLNLNDTYLVMNYKDKGKKSIHSCSTDVIMAKSSIKAGLEKEHSIPLLTNRILKLNRKKLREQTKGKDWYNLPATEVTDEVKNDLQILKMRSVLEKNHFYKKNDIKNISKYFQFGTVVETAADFYGGRIVKSQRKKTIVDELLADAECKNYQKKKFKEIMDASRRRKGSRIHKQKPQTKNKKSKKNIKKQN